MTFSWPPWTHVPPDAGGAGRGRAVVIGAGLGGLAAAIRLGARGYRVTVLEKLEQPGGRARVFRQDGFTFDAGPTILTAPQLLQELWALCGRRMEDDVDLRLMAPFYRIRFDDGMVFDCSGDPEAMEEQVTRFSPADVPGYRRFLRLSAAMCRVGFERLGDVPFSSAIDMVKVLPDLLRLGGHRSVYALVSRFFRDERLRIAFSFHPLLIGGNPFTASGIYALIPSLEQRWGVHSAVGGTGRVVAGLVGLVRGQGGSIRCNAPVAEITVADGRACGVRLVSGETIGADIVVSNADSVWTYQHLVPAAHRGRWSARRLDRTTASMGLFVWYFGTDRQYDAVAHHTIVLGPRYRGLLEDIFKHKILGDDFSLYLHRPTATDPSLAPSGHDTFYVLAPVPNLTAAIDWRAKAERYRERLAQRLAATVLPGLGDHIVTSRVMTPQDFADQLNAWQGSGFGIEPTLLQSAWFRPHNVSEDLPGLYLVGAGTHPGAGVPGVLSSAKVLDRVVPHAALG